MATDTAAKQIRVIEYTRPAVIDQPKVTVNLGSSDLLRVQVQVVQPHGGETNMHAHPALDSTWLVLGGRARFYGFGDKLIAEAGQNQGVFIPKGTPYWFEAAGEDVLEILHITALDRGIANDRVDYAPPVERQAERGAAARGRPPTEVELRQANESVSGR
jgi:mannose-6-phosphate isomerase-like protein (cupin superfamily)